MNGPAELAKGWIAKADSDLAAMPHTHNLEELGDCVTEAMPTLTLDVDELAEITPFAVEPRYDPDSWPDLETAKNAFSAAQRLREQIVVALPESARPWEQAKRSFGHVGT